MSKAATPTFEQIHAAFDYVPETGQLRRKSNGRIAGTIQTDGYRQVSIRGRLLLAHRVIWFMHHGKWPVHMIDHINGERDDNRIENLRDVPQVVNIAARGIRNCSGFKGVYPEGRWFHARIRIDDETKPLGKFARAEDAHQAFKIAHVMHYGPYSEFFDELHVPSPALIEYARQLIARYQTRIETNVGEGA